jgi:phosphatidylethanolamine-binding protein (PEBP) family uncharacterized protein
MLLRGGAPRTERALPEAITVSSPAFAAGAAIPQRFTCKGDNRSPPLAWSGVPATTVEAALVVDDPDAPVAPMCTGWSSTWTRPAPS